MVRGESEESADLNDRCQARHTAGDRSGDRASHTWARCDRSNRTHAHASTDHNRDQPGGRDGDHLTFTRTTQAIAAPQQTFLVSTTSSAPFTAHMLTITGNQIESVAIVPPTVVNPDFNVDMTVTNTTSKTFYSQFWWTITATDGVNTCRPTVDVHIPANSVIHMGCGLDRNTFDPHMPALTWDDTTGIPGLEFVGQNAAWVKQYQEVPANCGDPTPAVQALQTYLENTLENTKPTMAMGLGNLPDTVDYTSLTCTPPAGYQQYDGLAYNQFISGTRNWLYYFPQDIMNYQTQQLANQVPATDTLLNSSVCSLPTILDSNTNSGHVQCAATGTAAWNWTADALATLAQQLAGKDLASATALLNTTPGVVAGSAQITIAGGGTTLPQDPSTIAITVNN